MHVYNYDPLNRLARFKLCRSFFRISRFSSPFYGEPEFYDRFLVFFFLRCYSRERSSGKRTTIMAAEDDAYASRDFVRSEEKNLVKLLEIVVASEFLARESIKNLIECFYAR